MTDGSASRARDRKTFLVARNPAGAMRTIAEQRAFDHPVRDHFHSDSLNPMQMDW